MGIQIVSSKSIYMYGTNKCIGPRNVKFFEFSLFFAVLCLEMGHSFLWLVGVVGQLSLELGAKILVYLSELTDSAILENLIHSFYFLFLLRSKFSMTLKSKYLKQAEIGSLKSVQKMRLRSIHLQSDSLNILIIFQVRSKYTSFHSSILSSMREPHL